MFSLPLQEGSLRNVKHYSGAPSLSIKEVLRISNVSAEEIDGISVTTLCGGVSPEDATSYLKRLLEESVVCAASSISSVASAKEGCNQKEN